MHPGFSAATVAAFILLSMAAPEQGGGERIDLRVDANEARAVLAILAEKSSAGSACEEAWKRLFYSEPYVRLKKREASLRRDFTDEDFRKFVLSSGLAERSAELRTTLSISGPWRNSFSM